MTQFAADRFRKTRRFSVGPHDPRQLNTNAIEEGHLVVRGLWQRHVRRWSRLKLQAYVVNITNDADNLTRRRFLVIRARALSNQDALVQRTLIGPELPRQRLIHDDDRCRSSSIAIGERASGDQRDFENLKVTRRDEMPATEMSSAEVGTVEHAAW